MFITNITSINYRFEVLSARGDLRFQSVLMFFGIKSRIIKLLRVHRQFSRSYRSIFLSL